MPALVMQVARVVFDVLDVDALRLLRDEARDAFSERELHASHGIRGVPRGRVDDELFEMSIVEHRRPLVRAERLADERTELLQLRGQLERAGDRREDSEEQLHVAGMLG